MEGYLSKEFAESLKEDHLILKLRSTEHDFVERKSKTARGDWLQAAVAFANSAPISWPAVIFVGVGDDLKPQVNETSGSKTLQAQLEELSKSVSDIIEQAYPPIYRHIVPLHIENGGCLAVIVPGSPLRPHFAGRSYVRVGPETKEATAAQFDALVSERQELAYHLRTYIGKKVLVLARVDSYVKLGRESEVAQPRKRCSGSLVDCNRWYVTISLDRNHKGEMLCSWPLSRLTLSFDHSWNTIILEVGD